MSPELDDVEDLSVYLSHRVFNCLSMHLRDKELTEVKTAYIQVISPAPSTMPETG